MDILDLDYIGEKMLHHSKSGKEYVKSTIEVLKVLVLAIRKELSENCDIFEGKVIDTEGIIKGGETNYEGLSCLAIIRLYYHINVINQLMVSIGGEADLYIDSLHGEQKHLSDIKSNDWSMEHDWAIVKSKMDRNIKIYVDPTSQQFQSLYSDIPDYYISSKPPKWFFPDEHNFRWIFAPIITGIFNKNLFGTKVANTVERYFHKCCNFLVYDIHGRLSDIIYNYKQKYK